MQWFRPPRRIPALVGAVAQLGERGVRNAEVGSSILLRSTIFLPVCDLDRAALRPGFSLSDTLHGVRVFVVVFQHPRIDLSSFID